MLKSSEYSNNFLDYNKFSFEENSYINSSDQITIETICEELLLEIFSYLSYEQLASCCLVSKKWQRIANDVFLQQNKSIFAEMAIGNDKWIQRFGQNIINEVTEQDLLSLPKNIAKLVNKPCSIFEGQKIRDTHFLFLMPKTLHEGLSFNNLAQIAKTSLPETLTGYNLIARDVKKNLGDKSIENSYWVLISKKIIPDSQNKSYRDQKKQLVEISKKASINYDIPLALEVTTCMLATHFFSKEQLLAAQSDIANYTRCADKIYVRDYGVNTHLIVGDFNSRGVFVGRTNDVSEQIGILAVKRFL